MNTLLRLYFASFVSSVQYLIMSLFKRHFNENNGEGLNESIVFLVVSENLKSVEISSAHALSSTSLAKENPALATRFYRKGWKLMVCQGKHLTAAGSSCSRSGSPSSCPSPARFLLGLAAHTHSFAGGGDRQRRIAVARIVNDGMTLGRPTQTI